MKKKLLITLSVVACALLLVVGSIAGTIAYLTSTAKVTNTFTVGDIVITLDETDVDLYGEKAGDDRVTANEYKLIPGRKYTKDPVIHVDAGSESAYLFIKIVNEIDDIDLDDSTDGSIAKQLTENQWTCIDATNNIWKYNNKTAALTEANIDTFKTVTLKTNAVVSAYKDKTIEVTAYAVQADGFASAEAAWTATFGAPTT